MTTITIPGYLFRRWQTYDEMDFIIIPILQIRKLTLGEGNLTQQMLLARILESRGVLP